jgi:hypothetical protein
MNPQTGKFIILIGLVIIVVGVLIYFLHDKLHWIGKLPGDINFRRKNFRFYFPFTTMLLISLVLTVLINLIKRLF